MRRLYALAPAKVNLGLEIVGRRDDGYHDLVTLFQAVSLYDLFVWTETGAPFVYIGPTGVAQDTDLVWRALQSADAWDGWTGRLQLFKRIPMAAGLGGGSTDAALALRLALPDADDDELARRGAALGADVPFFIRGGTALATGTGTELEQLTTPERWLVLLTPSLEIPEKTRALYSGLEPEDYSDGANVRDITRTLLDATHLPEHLPNAFSRQLLGYPVIRYAYDRLGQAGASLVSVSGAGPTVYALTTSHQDATRIADRLATYEPEVGAVNVVRTVPARGSHPSIAAIAMALRGQ